MSSPIKISPYYTYAETNPSLGGISISMSIADSNFDLTDPIYGCRAYSTQKIMNNLPKWVDMREDRNSIGQKLTHSWACNLDNLSSAYDEYRAEQFLSTADTYPDVFTGVSELSFKEDKVYQAKFSNLLFNSSFSMLGPARLQKPEGWSVRRNGLIDSLAFDTGESLFGSHALVLDGSLGHVVLKQSRNLQQPGGSLNLSIFVKTRNNNSESDTGRTVPEDSGIVLVLNYSDGSTETFGLGFPYNTKGLWARASFNVGIKKTLHKYEVMIINRSNRTYIVDLPQLEIGTMPTFWTHSVDDVPIFLTSSLRNVTAAQVLLGKDKNDSIQKLELLSASSSDEFMDIIIPTRLELTSPNVNPDNTFDLSFGKEVTYGDETLDTKWIVNRDTGKIEQHSIQTADIFGNGVLPADLYKSEDGTLYLNTDEVDSGNISVESATVYRNWLLVSTIETYLNKTRRVLKFCKPQKLAYEDTILQSYGDIELPLDLDARDILGGPAQNVNMIGICRNLPYTIFIDTNLKKRFYLQMKYDYFFADLRRRKLFCRENYAANNSELQVI